MTPETPPNPLSDEQLDRLLKQHKPVPPPDWQDRFWQDLEPKLSQEGGQSADADFKPIRNPRMWLRPPIMAAAAAFIVLLVSVPMTRNLAQNPNLDQVDNSLGSVHENPGPMTLGRGVDTPPGQAAPQSPIHQAGMAQKSLVPDKGERMQQEAGGHSAQDTESQEEDGLSAAQLRPPSETKGKQTAGSMAQNMVQSESQPADAKADETARQQLEEMLKPLQGEIKELEPGRFEIRLPAEQGEAFKAKLKDWPVGHNLLEQALHEKQQLVYQIELRP